MRANKEFVKSVFRDANGKIFGGQLPEFEIRIGSAARSFGSFNHPRNVVRRDPSQCRITISAKYDLTEAELTDIIIHEMIHAFIWWKNIDDTSTHGEAFRTLMRAINLLHGRKIDIRFSPEEGGGQESDSAAGTYGDKLSRFYFCISNFSDGKRYITVCATTCIFDINRLLLSQRGLVSLDWYFSLDPWFSRYPKVRKAKYYSISDAEFEKYVGPAKRCVIEGNRFRLLAKKK